MTGVKAPTRIQRLETFKHVTFINRASDKVPQTISHLRHPSLASMSILRARSRIHHLSCSNGVRMISTITGDTGRIYTNGTLIRRHPQDEELDIYKAECDSI